MIATLAEFCQSHPPDDWSRLPENTRLFLQQLDLPALHPLCGDDNSNLTSSLLLLLQESAAAATTSFSLQDDDDNNNNDWLEHFITTVLYQTLLPFMALIELWLRLFCGYFVPLALAYQFLRVHQQGRAATVAVADDDQKQKQQQQPALFWLTLAGCMILMTDSNYVYEYGPWYGCFCFGSCWLVGAIRSNGVAAAAATAATTIMILPLPPAFSSNNNCGTANTTTTTTTTDTKQTSCHNHRHHCWSTIVMTTLILGLTFKLTLWDAGKDCCLSFPPHIQFGTDIDIHIQPGVYFDNVNAHHRYINSDENNNTNMNNIINSNNSDDDDNNNNKCQYQTSTLVQRAMALCSPDKYTYQDPTPWILTGDARTGLPYLWNRPVFPDYYTVYLTTSNDDAFADNRILPEIIAVALAFPSGGYNASAPFYVVVHGMNGGPEDGYIQDFVNRRTTAGSSAAILLARGLHGMPLVSGQIFSVARTSDLHALAKALRQVHPGPIASVGYSIGAIVLSHYVVAPQYSNEPFPLDAAFSISGALDARQEATYYRPQRVWLPMIAEFFRSHQYVLPSNDAAASTKKNDLDNTTYITSARLLHQRLQTPQQVQAMMRARHTIDLDEYSIVPFYNYSSVLTYYAHQSALGDISMQDWSSPDLPLYVLKQSHLAQHLKIPLGVLHSLDDPIATWRNNFANTGWMHPERLVQLNENLVLILTERGGHVGWPLSSRPWRRGWEFMNEAASSFVEAVVAAKAQRQQDGPDDK